MWLNHAPIADASWLCGRGRARLVIGPIELQSAGGKIEKYFCVTQQQDAAPPTANQLSAGRGVPA